MKFYLLFLLFITAGNLLAADKKITDFTLLPAASFATGDVMAIVDVSANETKKTRILDLDTRYQSAYLADGNIFVGNASNAATSVTMSGDVTLTNTGAASIGTNKVLNSMLAQVATNTFKGRVTASTGNVEDLSATQATGLLNVMVGDSGSGGTKGLAPAPGAGDAALGKFLKADGTWQTIPGGGGGSLVGYRVDGLSSPDDYYQNTIPFLRFNYDSSDPQYYYFKIKVPSSYVAGDRIKLSSGKFKVNSSDTSKRVLIQLSTHLIKTGDALGTFANAAYVSTNSEVAVTSTAESAIPIGDMYMNSALGQIDSRNIAGGDTLIVQMTRNISSESAPVIQYVDILKDDFNLSFKD